MSLPPEIIALILRSIHNKDSSEPYLLRVNDERERLKTLQACCLINRDWHAQSTSLLYSRFKHTGDQNSFAKLWHFLRTITEKPELGKLVKHLDLRERYSWTIGRNKKISPREQRSRRQEAPAICATAVQLQLKQLPDALQRQARAPFMAILMTYLSNVSRLHLAVNYFGPRDGDQYFTKSFLQTLEESSVLPQLTEATFFDPYSLDDSNKRSYHPAVRMSGTESWFLRPHIDRLEFFDLEACRMPAVSYQSLSGKSDIAHLTITCGGDARLPLSDNAGLKACLELPKALTSLTLCLQSFMSMGGDNRLNYMIAHDELWHILCRHSHTLEYLDLFDADATFKQFRPEFNRKAPMGKMNGFNRLSTLRIQPEMLIGGINGILKAPYTLRETLPPSLQSLTLYNFYAADGLINCKHLQTELCQMLEDPTFFEKLKFLIIQDTCHNFLRNLAPASEVYNSINAVQRACIERNIIFRVISYHYLPRGGSNLLQHLEAYKPEERANHAWKKGLDGLRAETPERARYEFVLPPGRDLVTLT